VPAHDEADVLPFLVADLGRQDLRDASGEPTFEVVVVDDRSVDGTGRIARAAAGEAGLSSRTSVVRREPASGPDGKATALAAVPDDLVRGEAVLVLDADARLAPDALRRVAGAFAAGHDALTMPRRVDGARLLDRLQDAEQVLDARLQRTRAALGGRPELRGNGMAVRTSILREVGGWRPGSLTEDLDLSTRLAAAGIRVRVVDDVVVHELPAASPADLAGQRLRWAEGAVRRHLELLPGALLAGTADATVRLDLLAGALALAAAPALPQALAAAALGRRPATLVALLGAWLAGGTILSLAALREPGSGPARSSSRLLFAAGEAIYLLHWPLAIPTALLLVALRPGRARFRRTRRRPPAPKTRTPHLQP